MYDTPKVVLIPMGFASRPALVKWSVGQPVPNQDKQQEIGLIKIVFTVFDVSKICNSLTRN
jgi:hypothetical protein